MCMCVRGRQAHDAIGKNPNSTTLHLASTHITQTNSATKETVNSRNFPKSTDSIPL